MIDVVTLGETMLRLSPPAMQRLEHTTHFAAQIGGSESNTAVGLARLELRVTWLSRLPDNPLGRWVWRTLAGQGVDVSRVVWADDSRLGLYFLEEGPAPRGSSVVYDRRDSAFSQMRPDDLPANLFQPEQAKLLHLTGITPALGDPVRATAQRAVNLARRANWQISFDLNHRHKLWSPAEALPVCEVMIEAANLFFLPRRDALSFYGFEPHLSSDEILDQLSLRYPHKTIVLTLGEKGAIGCDPTGTVRKQAAFTAEGTLGRVGGGDAFTAGFLYGYLSYPDTPLVEGLRWGAALAALKYTIPGDMPLVEKHEVEQLLASAPGRGGISR